MCQICNQRHNTMLHVVRHAGRQSEGAHAVSTNTANATGDIIVGTNVMLATALINVADSEGVVHQFRALLDQGSQVSFVSEEAAAKLSLPRRRVNININGVVGETTGKARQVMMFEFSSRFNPLNKFKVTALVINRVTKIPKMTVVPTYQWPHIVDLPLADPSFVQQHKIDMLLGCDVYGTLLLPGLRQRIGFPTAQNTILGWVLSGSIPQVRSYNEQNGILSYHCSIDDGLSRFWEQEETSSKRMLTAEEEQCEKFFEATVKRDLSGRLHVRIPLRDENTMFGVSQHMAVQRQLQIERRFLANPEFARKYRLFMEEYETLGHMSEVKGEQVDISRHRAELPTSKREYFIPHHAVVKDASTTTKLRVVFDASCKTTNGMSLNEAMMIGPRLQDDLSAIVMRWRRYRFAFSADIEKMYRQIKVDVPDANLQRIVWRPHADEPLRIYQLATVTYGTASAPYLAVKALQTLAHRERERYPQGAEITLNSFYVDDVLSGADNIESCVDFQKQLIDMLASGGFTLRKWVSNCEAILQKVPPEHRECQLPLNIDDGGSIKTLGIQWCPSTDQLCFNVPEANTNTCCTKRMFLSQAAQLYDPLGWLAPSTILVKILFQKLWKAKVDWDEELPTDIAEQWSNLKKSIVCLKTLRLPRWINTTPGSSMELHGFCDASMDAYSAVVYLRVTGENGVVTMHNLSAKTKVAPLKVISLPRLELCGAALLTKLMVEVRTAMHLEDVHIQCWTDSTIVLAWLRAEPSRFSVFVANRISEIQRNSSFDHWRHVRSEHNPADCASRGITPSKLVTHELWWSGPPWLLNQRNDWPIEAKFGETSEEMRAHAHSVTTTKENWQFDLITTVSSWRRLARITAWCRRFGANCRATPASRETTGLTVRELCEARDFWVRDAQGGAFESELRCLRNDTPIGKSSRLKALNPILSSDNIVRVGGRLANAETLSPHARSPSIIPKRSPLSALIVADAHNQTLHGGPSLMLAYMRRSYWVIDGPKEVKRYVKSCVKCFRWRASPSSQMMAALPAARVVPSRPFVNTALDYSGAIKVRASRGRGQHASKAYVCVFVCLATKAVHIELASDLSTDAFIAAYERFVARRGLCVNLYSDNATNFVGAARVFLRSERALFDASVQSTLAARGTNWHFSPPLSPHFNGLAESAIRSVKHHVRRIIGDTTLTFEEMSTVLSKIEACLNSRPLHPMSSEPTDFDVLTPGHFLIGEPTVTIPSLNATSEGPVGINRWKLMKQLVQRFWARWSVDYLHTLQQRRKWQISEPNLRVGDMVLVLEDNQPPSKWAIGRIIETHPGDDGRVRVVTIRSRDSTYKRSVVRVARLPSEDVKDNTEV